MIAPLDVPLLDASGVAGVDAFVVQARRAGAQIIFSSVRPQPMEMLRRGKLDEAGTGLHFVESFDDAIRKAEMLIGDA